MARKRRKKLTVRRAGYTRKGFTAHRGRTTYRVKRTRVPPTTFKIRDRGAPGRGPKLIKIVPGVLGRYGYTTSKPAPSRHRALSKAIRAVGKARVWHALHAQVIFRKRAPDHAKTIFERDRDWITATYGGPTPKAAIRKWKRMSPRARARAMPGGRI